MSRGATLALKITGDSRDGVRSLDDVESKSGRTGKALGSAIAGGAAVAVAAVAGIAVAAFDAASKLEQSTGAIDAVFGDWALDIEQAAEKADKTLGLSQSSYQELAAVIGSQLKNAGMDIGDVTGATQDLIEKGADLAAVFGGSAQDAVGALSSALKGEMDPIERFGVTLNQSAVDAKLAELGLEGLEGAAADAAKKQAILGLITDQTKDSVGAAARESDTAAGKMGQLSAMWENGKAALGEKLLPVFVFFADFIQQRVAPVVERLIGAGGPLSTMFATAAAFITGQVVPALSSLWDELGPKLVPIFETVSGIINDHVMPAFMAIWGVINDYIVPIIGSVLGPVLDGIQSLWGSVSDALDRNADKFSGLLDKVRPLLEFLRDTVAPFIGGVLKEGFEILGDVIGKVVDAIAWVLDKAAAVGGFIGDVGSFLFGGSAAPAPAGGGGQAGGGVFGAARGARPLLFGASGALAAGGTSPSAGGQGFGETTIVNVTFTGAVVGLDLDSVADELQRIMAARARRTGAAPAFAVAR